MCANSARSKLRILKPQSCSPAVRYGHATNTRVGIAAVQLPLALPLVVDPCAQRQALGPALRHGAVAVFRLVGNAPL
jgi:hypothetical protein